MRYCSGNIECLFNSENGLNEWEELHGGGFGGSVWAARLALWVGGLVYLWACQSKQNRGGGGLHERQASIVALPAPTVVAHRGFARIKLWFTVSKSEGTGRERRVRVFCLETPGKVHRGTQEMCS